jgi:hypothetical protein
MATAEQWLLLQCGREGDAFVAVRTNTPDMKVTLVKLFLARPEVQALFLIISL